jgi:hypothetical protein
MPRKLTRLFSSATLLVAVAALVAPASALAQGKHKKHHQPSAVDVYVEQVQTAGGHQSAPGSGGTASNATTGGGTSSSSQLSSKAQQQLHSQGGKDTPLLTQVASQAGNERKLAMVGSTSQPGTFDAAFDLGAGPTVLFALVLATGLFVAVGGGLRGYRRLRRPNS